MRIKPWVFFGLFLGTAAQAGESPRESPVPGGIAIVSVAPDSEPVPVVQFDGNRVLVVRDAGRWKAVVGLPLTLAPGLQLVKAVDDRGVTREYSFTV